MSSLISRSIGIQHYSPKNKLHLNLILYLDRFRQNKQVIMSVEEQLADITRKFKMMKRMRNTERDENKKLKQKGDVADEVFEGLKKNEKEYIHRNNILQRENERLKENRHELKFPEYKRLLERNEELEEENKELKGKGHEAYIRNITTIKKLKEATEEIEGLKKENQELFEELEYMKKENKEFNGYMID